MKRIHVVYYLKADEENQEVINRVHDMHADHCPVARSIRDAIDISTEVVLE